MHPPLDVVPFAAALVLGLPLAAQPVGVELSAFTPLTAQVSVGGGPAVVTVPPGPLPSSGGIGASLPNAPGEVGVVYQALATSTFAVVNLTHSIGNPAQLPFFTGEAGPHAFLVRFTSPTPRAATLDVRRFVELSPGAPMPTVALDYGNDGTIDVPNVSPLQGASTPVALGPQPFDVRVIVTATLGGQLGSFDYTSVRLLPDNDLTIVTPVAACASVQPPPAPLVQPSFDDTGVVLTQQFPFPSVIVVGFAAQPVLLGANAAVPCILLPSPDVLLIPPNGQFALPLPASVRPVTFHVQCAGLFPQGLLVSDGVSVTAS